MWTLAVYSGELAVQVDWLVPEVAGCPVLFSVDQMN